MLPREASGGASWVSCHLPGPACPAGELDRQRSFCLCKQSGLGVRPGLTQRSFLSVLGWQGGQACRWPRARWEPEPNSSEFANQLTPLLPGWTFPRPSGSDPTVWTALKVSQPALGQGHTDSSPGWVLLSVRKDSPKTWASEAFGFPCPQFFLLLS